MVKLGEGNPPYPHHPVFRPCIVIYETNCRRSLPEAYPPKKLARPFLGQIYPKLDRVVYLHHHNYSEGDLEPFLMSHSHYRILIGCSRQPACLAPSGCRRTDSGIPYYRLHKTGLTYLYVRGYSLESLRRFSLTIQDSQTEEHR